MSLRPVALSCLLALFACDPPEEEPLPTPAPETMVLLDDFTAARLDGVWRWSGGDTERLAVQGGDAVLETRLVHAESPGVSQVISRLRPKVSGRVDQISALLTVDEYESVYASARTLVVLAYQPVADRGTDQNLLLIRAGVHATDTNALRTSVQVYHCSNAACTESHPMSISVGDFPSGVHTATGVSHRFTVRYEDDADRFVLEVDGRRATVDASTLVGFDPDDFLYAEVRNEARWVFGPGDRARMTTRVHEVSIDGALYDDFNGSRIDPAKWVFGDLERRLDPDGGVTLALGSGDANQSVRLPLRAARSANELAATVRVDEVAFDSASPSPPVARIGGHWYTDGTSQQGGGAAGNIYASVDLVGGTQVRWVVVRCVSPDCAEREFLGTGDLGSSTVGTEEELYVGLDDTVFTFRRGTESATFDAGAEGAPRIGAPTIATKGLEVRHLWEGVGDAYLRANFSDVRTDPPGRITLGDHAWVTQQAVSGGLRGVVAVGWGEDGPVLHATRGAADGMSCVGADCLALRLDIEAPEEGTDFVVDRPYAVTGSWREGSATSDVNGTVTFAEVGATLEGALNLTTSGGGLAGTFRSTWHPYATVSPRHGTEEYPAWVHGGCATWPFCSFATSPTQTTRLAIPKPPSATRAFRLNEGGSGVKVYGASGNLLCTSVRVADEHVCRVTGGGDTLYAEVEPAAGAAGPPVLSVHEDYQDLTLATPSTATIDVGDSKWFRLRDAAGPHVVQVVTQDAASGGLDINDSEGRYINGNGWCCGEGNTQQVLFSEPGGTLWARVNISSDQSWVPYSEASSTFTIEAREASSGASPDEAAEVTTARAYWAFNYMFRHDDEALHLQFQMPTSSEGIHSGPGLVRVEVMDWRQVVSPVDVLVYTDPSDPEGSAVRTTEGGSCAAQLRPNGGDGRWEAICYALFDPAVTYYARLGGDGVLQGAHGVFRIDTYWEAGTLVDDPDVEHTGSLGPGDGSRFVSWTEAGKGYNNTAKTYDTGGSHRGLGLGLGDLTASDDHCEWYCWSDLGGIGTWDWDDPIRTFGFFLAADQVPPFVYYDVRNWESDGAAIDYVSALRETGSGLAVEDPADVQDPILIHQDGHLDPGAAHYYRFTAAYAGYDLGVNATDPHHGPVPTWDGGWTLETGGSEVASCVPDHEQVARCAVSLDVGTTYVLRIANDNADDRIRYTIRGEF